QFTSYVCEPTKLDTQPMSCSRQPSPEIIDRSRAPRLGRRRQLPARPWFSCE
ncbi:unnamed protein product, partial [Ectocarpus sp. 13 AM-2016]